MRLRRFFWIGAAGLLGLAALISIVALLRGEFTDTDGKILGTLAAAFLTGSGTLAGIALIERRDLPLLGWTVAAVSTVVFGAPPNRGGPSAREGAVPPTERVDVTCHSASKRSP